MDQAFWDERYRQKAAIWSGNPNPQLVDCAGELAPGRALDVGAGEGADAIWLAERGWQVLALDISPVALERGAKRATELGDDVAAAIEWRQADLNEAPPPTASFELVSVQFLHLPPDARRSVYASLAAAVAPGGALLIVGHHPSDLDTGVRRPSNPELLFTAEQLAEELGIAGGDREGERWTILAQDARPRAAKDQDGNPVTVHDTVLFARRL